jgi:hypothetical protein
MDSYYHAENRSKERINDYQREAEKEAIINEAKASEPNNIRQAIGRLMIEIGTKIAQAPESQRA